MRPKQWEPIEVVLNLVNRDAPSPHRVAVLASGAKLAAVNVGMTIRALLAHLREDFADVALAASYIGVHGAERVFRFGVVIELRLGADRLPAHRGMATFAGDRKWPMRVLGLLFGRLRAKQHCAPEEQNGHPCAALSQVDLRR